MRFYFIIIGYIYIYFVSKMRQTSVNLDEKTYENVRISGISLRKLIQFGLKYVENNKENSEDLKRVEENIGKFSQEIKRLRTENLNLCAQISIINKEKLENRCSETVKNG